VAQVLGVTEKLWIMVRISCYVLHIDELLISVLTDVGRSLQAE
jgi:hypothetical protein